MPGTGNKGANNTQYLTPKELITTEEASSEVNGNRATSITQGPLYESKTTADYALTHFHVPWTLGSGFLYWKADNLLLNTPLKIKKSGGKEDADATATEGTQTEP